MHLPPPSIPDQQIKAKIAEHGDIAIEDLEITVGGWNERLNPLPYEVTVWRKVKEGESPQPRLFSKDLALD